MYSQVQLYYSGDNYFVADQVFVKYTTNQAGKEIVDDILVIENKLSSTTALTTPQNGALKSSSYRVRSRNKFSEINSNNPLEYGIELKFSDKIQWYKVHDGSSEGKIIDGIINIK
jgi:hypothetical protein